ncbi:MAG: flagellar hook-length control protein FliK [Acetatifactor sp.]
MNLTQLLNGGTFVSEKGYSASNNAFAHGDELYKQIRSLTPGQTIQGEVLDRTGSEVQIKVSGDVVLNARVDQSIHLEPGQNIIFEVRSNGKALSLSPLFTNVSADINVLKAIDMSGLPVNQTTISMTEQMMKAGMPVNRNALSHMFREINSYPEAKPEDIVSLHKLGMAVNEENLQQVISYRNLSHALTDGIKQVIEALPQVIDEMVSQGDYKGVFELYRALGFHLSEVTEVQAENVLPDSNNTELPFGLNTEQKGALENVELPINDNTEQRTDDILNNLNQKPFIGGDNELNMGSVSEGIEAQEKTVELRTPDTAVSNSAESQELQKILQQDDPYQKTEFLHHSEGRIRELSQTLVKHLKQQWTIQPEQVEKPENIEQLYRNLDRQLKAIKGVLEAAGHENGAAYKAAINLSGNIDFMNQLNQMYTYVQLPLQLQHAQARGELYVYTNKRNLAAKDGQVSALLHLDMENLGPLDVYVTMKDAKVNTNFCVADEEILVFLEQHMNFLTERLQKRGYDCKCTMRTREVEQTGMAGDGHKNSGIAPLLQEDEMILSQHAFDVRT